MNALVQQEHRALAPADTRMAVSDVLQHYALVQEVRQKRPLIKLWVESGELQSVQGGVARLAFPTEQSLAADYLQQPTHRKFLEDVLSAHAGEPVKLKVELSAGLQVKPPPSVVEEKPKDPVEEFRNDPLIRKALEIFQAEIQPA